MQEILYSALAVQLIALVTSAIFIPADAQEMRIWVKRVCN